ncbi:hypothetical protein BGZ46_010848, partial [Entomortierella lignicola]
MEPGASDPSIEELIELRKKSNATEEDHAVLKPTHERIAYISRESESLKAIPQHAIQPLSSVTAKPLASTFAPTSDHTGRKLVLDDIIPRYGKDSSATSDPSRKYRVISNAMEFLDVFHSRASSVYGDSSLTGCACLLSLAILDAAERQQVESAINNIPRAERTWELCEQTFIDELKTAHQKTQEAIKVIKAGMTKGESCKRYAWRLERLNRIYKISGSAFEEQVVSRLKLSIPAVALNQLNIHFSIVQFHGKSGWTFTPVTTIKDFAQALLGVAGPDDCDERRHSREYADRDEDDDRARPAKKSKIRHDGKNSAVSSKPGQTFFCRNGCGTNRSHSTEGCLICGRCKGRGRLADQCTSDTAKDTFPTNAAANGSHKGNRGSFSTKGRHHGGKSFQRGNYQGRGANGQSGNSQGTLTDSMSFIFSESPSKTIANSAILLNTVQTEPSVTV